MVMLAISKVLLMLKRPRSREKNASRPAAISPVVSKIKIGPSRRF
jgi:hypothetical protein